MVIAQVLLSEVIRKSIPNDPSLLAKDIFDKLGPDPIDVTDIEKEIREYLELFAQSHHARAMGRASVHYKLDHLQAAMVVSSFILLNGKKHPTG